MSKIENTKKNLPYGKVILKNGCQILFNRHYRFIPSDRHFEFTYSELVMRGAKTVWFYTDGNPPWVDKEIANKCQNILRVFSTE